MRPIIEATGAHPFIAPRQCDAPPDTPAFFQQRVVPAHLFVRRYEAVVRHAIVGNHLRVRQPGENRIDITTMNSPQRAAWQEKLGEVSNKVHQIHCAR